MDRNFLRKLLIFFFSIVLFFVFLIVDFFILAITAAVFFPGIVESPFAYIYALVLPPTISALEVYFIRRRFFKGKSILSTVSDPPVGTATNSSLTVSEDEPPNPVSASHDSVIHNPDSVCEVSASISNPSASIRSECAKYGGIEAQLLNIDLMEGHDFEHWCAALLLKIGFQRAEVTPGSNDDGVDIIAQKDGIRYAIQCKRYTSDLGNKPIQEVHTGKSVYHCHVGAVMTNRYFTQGGKRAAEATGTLLWDRNWITWQLASIFSVVSGQAPTSPRHEEVYDLSDIENQLPAAIDVILETGQASVSMLQRKLGLGYVQCVRIMDELENRKIVSPFLDFKPREILITKEQLHNL